MTKEKTLHHWRCPECGRLYSDTPPFEEEVYCLGESERFVYRPARSPHTKLHWVKMKRFSPEIRKASK